MAITHRRGNHTDFDPGKMLPGEFGYCLDTAELYYCYAAGNVKKLLTTNDVQEILNSSTKAYAALQKIISELEADAELSSTILAHISDAMKHKQSTGCTQNGTNANAFGRGTTANGAEKLLLVGSTLLTVHHC